MLRDETITSADSIAKRACRVSPSSPSSPIPTMLMLLDKFAVSEVVGLRAIPAYTLYSPSSLQGMH